MTATARLDLRMNVEDKDKIARAARLRGIPVATFVRLAALREANAVSAKAVGSTGFNREVAAQLRGRATARWSTDEIMRLTRGA